MVGSVVTIGSGRLGGNLAWLSQRAYAKHRGCRLSAVQRAIKDGRLSKSLGRNADGPWQITDAALADAEWSATTKDNRVPIGVQLQREAAAPPVPRPVMPLPTTEEDAPEDAAGPIPDRAVSAARREAAEAALAEIELAEKRGKLLPVEDVEAKVAGDYATVRTKLLGVPALARQRDPTITPTQLALIDDLIRESLQELAGRDEQPAVAVAS